MESSSILAWILAAISGLGLISMSIKEIWSYRLKKKIKEVEDRNDNAEKYLNSQKLEKTREIMREEIQPLMKEVDKIEQDLSIDKQATIASIRNEMYNLWKKCEERQTASVTEKANWNELYDAYTKLGGNHFKEYVNQWKNGMDELPLKD